MSAAALRLRRFAPYAQGDKGGLTFVQTIYLTHQETFEVRASGLEFAPLFRAILVKRAALK